MGISIRITRHAGHAMRAMRNPGPCTCVYDGRKFGFSSLRHLIVSARGPKYVPR